MTDEWMDDLPDGVRASIEAVADRAGTWDASASVLQAAGEIIWDMRRELTIASEDIGQWCKLAEEQRGRAGRPDHEPACPSNAGIQRSREVQAQIAAAMRLVPYSSDR